MKFKSIYTNSLLEIICRLTNSNYEWFNELSLYCSNLQFEIIDLFLYKNIRSYIDKSLFLNNLNFLIGLICYFIKMIYHSRRITYFTDEFYFSNRLYNHNIYINR